MSGLFQIQALRRWLLIENRTIALILQFANVVSSVF